MNGRIRPTNIPSISAKNPARATDFPTDIVIPAARRPVSVRRVGFEAPAINIHHDPECQKRFYFNWFCDIC
jgi:hypothetical protein